MGKLATWQTGANLRIGKSCKMQKMENMIVFGSGLAFTEHNK